MPEIPREADPVGIVAAWLNQGNRLSSIAEALRDAIDYVLDGAHTGRYDIESLDKIEKTFIGLKAEHFIMSALGLAHTTTRGGLDTVIDGEPVDIKFSLATSWMIPREAVGHVCILTSANDSNSTYSLGVFLAEDVSLGRPNRDKKRSILREARETRVRWLRRNAPLPENVLLHLPDADRRAIFALPTGQRRVREFFRLVRDRPIPKKVLSTVAQQDEPRARARDAARVLRSEGLFVYTHLKNREAEAYGLPPMLKGWWMAGSVDADRLLVTDNNDTG